MPGTTAGNTKSKRLVLVFLINLALIVISKATTVIINASSLGGFCLLNSSMNITYNDIMTPGNK